MDEDMSETQSARVNVLRSPRDGDRARTARVLARPSAGNSVGCARVDSKVTVHDES